MTVHDIPSTSLSSDDVVLITPIIGAEIRNVRLSGNLPEGVIAEIKSRIARHKVVFFRRQDHLDDAGQESFARLLGELVPHPTQHIREGSAAILELDSGHGGRADQWHTDVTFVPAYPKYSVLRGITIPETGGDTIWANTAAAYDALPEPLKRFADNLRAVHSNAYDYASHRPWATEVEKKHYDEVFRSKVFQTDHPVVRVHPETGEHTLILGSFVQRFAGFDRFASIKLYELFQTYITAPENTVRWRWKAGDVAIWDNRATQHIAVNDYGDAHRVVRRVTIDGDLPIGPDGRPSLALQ
ncbi:TauD/TfdA dioxygenase family protein [Polymorphum gilvum]|uniref:Putative taurine dioxygenase protein n=1 Tax=Polymorphum gilvum (strain LMG 25793 / CGMCC 1.9160 / SL003B-26A1) TaxID=991905 RepID=F2J2E8_POLGS|nr:TauD/TfdA family dioxygenase [Polymorphum gilvum]ADZ69844.1 Putative taurine dioxygenase protein [Polymorphum gilvum SL003B-26A1]